MNDVTGRGLETRTKQKMIGIFQHVLERGDEVSDLMPEGWDIIALMPEKEHEKAIVEIARNGTSVAEFTLDPNGEFEKNFVSASHFLKGGTMEQLEKLINKVHDFVEADKAGLKAQEEADKRAAEEILSELDGWP